MNSYTAEHGHVRPDRPRIGQLCGLHGHRHERDGDEPDAGGALLRASLSVQRQQRFGELPHGLAGQTDAYTLMPEPTQATGIGFGTLGHDQLCGVVHGGQRPEPPGGGQGRRRGDWTAGGRHGLRGRKQRHRLGADLGGGNFLVHRGTSPFTLSGLTAETEYHIRIFEYQGTNTTLNYNTNAASGQSLEPLHAQRGADGARGHVHGHGGVGHRDRTGLGRSHGRERVRHRAQAPGRRPRARRRTARPTAQGDALGDGTVVFVTRRPARIPRPTATARRRAPTTTTGSSLRVRRHAGQRDPQLLHRRDGADRQCDHGAGRAGHQLDDLLLPAGQRSSATMVWTNAGSADGTIILVKSNAAVNSNPATGPAMPPMPPLGRGRDRHGQLRGVRRRRQARQR
jgi:hypothetical protein